MIKLIVAGSRDFNDYNFLVEKLDHLLCKTRISACMLISGKARGADSLGEQYAKLRGFPVLEFPANWDLYGKSAGYKRNAEMAKIATHCVCFWDGKSKGTGHMINLAKDQDLDLRIIRYDK
jgi:hypothetical protein